MTKKDYELVAAVLGRELWKQHNDPATMLSVIASLGYAFGVVNERFDSKRFVAACCDNPSLEVHS